MDALIQEMRERGIALNPAATPSEIEELHVGNGEKLPPDLVRIYLDHDGMPEQAALPMRLLSLAEVGEIHEALTENDDYELPLNGGLFWTDDNSNFAGVFLAGKLSGRVFFFDHEEPDETPLFWTIESFYRHLLDHDGDWYDMPRDYPAVDDSSQNPRGEEDLQLARDFLTAYQADPDDPQSVRRAFFAMNLMPHGEVNELMPLLDAEDMWVQERAAGILGAHRYTEAIPHLFELAQSGTHNGRIASILALKDMETTEAAKRLEELRETLNENWKIYLR